MLIWIQYIMFAIVLLSLACSVFYSFRYRMNKEPILRGLFAARMNIWMGILLIAVALTQLVLYDLNNVRMIFGTIFLLIGLFNLFAGLRNRTHFLSFTKEKK